MNIYVSVGTHEQPFQRLLDAVALAVDEAGDHRYIVQYGVGEWSAISDRVERAVDYLTPQGVAESLEWADIFISQASPGNVFGALDAGVWPLVLGRRHANAEHVDDHQVRFASVLEEMGLATDIHDAGTLAHKIAEAATVDPEERRARIADAMRSSEARREMFREQTWSLILGLRGARA
ncbi:glycosyltransferase [Microbacterium sp. 5K110]|jgi:UDP-N-acetylglucosamine transferase subunit ALG13|uniref:glycosyltransferase n=1 Tax=unclassified Microbacterium TaxID=2609290 RepID=UPI0014856512|nr:glycosyltransferase [Microbacterium sp. 5K110]